MVLSGVDNLGVSSLVKVLADGTGSLVSCLREAVTPAAVEGRSQITQQEGKVLQEKEEIPETPWTHFWGYNEFSPIFSTRGTI